MQLQLLRNEINLTIRLASPLIAALLAQTTMELVNSLMLGQLGPEALAAGGLGMALFFMLMVICVGLLNAAGVLIARSYGAGNHSEINIIISQAIYLAGFLGVICMGFLWFVPQFLLWIGEEPEIVTGASLFLHALLWGFPPLLVFFALREFVAALSFTRIIMILSLCITPLTALGNYILMYGKFGLPALGIAGIGYSTAGLEWCLVIAMLYYIFKNNTLNPYIYRGLQPIIWKKIGEIIKLGVPVSMTMGFEVGLFSVTTLMMGYFGAVALAAHQIALQCATFAFMFPLGLAQATAIRVGQTLGAGSVMRAKYAGYAGLILGVVIAIITAIICLSFPTVLIGLFISTNKPNHEVLITSAVSFLGVMALFQLFDAVQVIMNGALRGLKDTFVPMWLGLLSYWLTGLISGYCLAFIFHLGGIGLWWGLGLGIGVSAILLILRFIHRMKQEERNLVYSAG